MRLRPQRGANSIERKSGAMSSKKASKKIKPTGMEYMQHTRIKSKAIGKRTKPKKLCKRIKHGRKGKMMALVRMMYECIEHESAE